jgi:hypothetical protein
MLSERSKQWIDDLGASMSQLTVEHINDAIAHALANESRLTSKVLEIHGFATPTMRRMFSNLCNLDGLRYLEVGVYCGATFISAYHGNPIHAVGIDNFSQTWTPGRDIKAEFAQNNIDFLNPETKSVRFFCDDCFNPALLPQIGTGVDIFYFDGDHSKSAQANALPHFLQILSDIFLFIVDDFNWPDVKWGTEAGFDMLLNKLDVIREWKLVGEKDADDPIWHNGVCLYLCHKK